MITRALSLAVVALVVAGCGGGGGDKAAATPAPTHAAGALGRHAGARGRPGGPRRGPGVGGHAAARRRRRRVGEVRAPEPRLQRHVADQAPHARAGPVLQPHAPLRREGDGRRGGAAPVHHRHLHADRAPGQGQLRHGRGADRADGVPRPRRPASPTGSASPTRPSSRRTRRPPSPRRRRPVQHREHARPAGRPRTAIRPARHVERLHDGPCPPRPPTSRHERVDVAGGRSTASSAAGSSRPAPAAAA